MLDVDLIIKNPENIKKALIKRECKVDLNKLILLYENKKKLSKNLVDLNTEKNII